MLLETIGGIAGYTLIAVMLGDWFGELLADEADTSTTAEHRVVGYLIGLVWPVGVLAVAVGWFTRLVLGYLAYSPVGRHRRN